MHWRTSRQWHPRNGISRGKEPMLAAVQHILAQRVEFWPLRNRSIHYALLNDPPLRHGGKPGSAYTNDRATYRDLTDLLSRAWPNVTPHFGETRRGSHVSLQAIVERSFRHN